MRFACHLEILFEVGEKFGTFCEVGKKCANMLGPFSVFLKLTPHSACSKATSQVDERAKMV